MCYVPSRAYAPSGKWRMRAEARIALVPEGPFEFEIFDDAVFAERYASTVGAQGVSLSLRAHLQQWQVVARSHACVFPNVYECHAAPRVVVYFSIR